MGAVHGKHERVSNMDAGGGHVSTEQLSQANHSSLHTYFIDQRRYFEAHQDRGLKCAIPGAKSLL